MKSESSSPELEAVRLLGALRQVVGELVGLEEDTGELGDHPAVEFLVRVFVSQKLLDRLRVVDLLLMILQFLFRDRHTDLGGRDMHVHLFDLAAREIRL